MADVDIEASPDGLAHDFLLILRLGPIEDHAPPAATPPRQGHGNDFVHLLGREFAVSSTISRTRLAPRRFGCSFRVPREKGAACRLLARWASSNCCLSRSFSSLSRSRSRSSRSRSRSHCFSRRRKTSFSLRSRSLSWRTARHRCRSCSIFRFHPRRVAENIGSYLWQLTLTKSEGFRQP